MKKTYRELLCLPTFKERFEYLKLSGQVGRETFGSKRYLNQLLYKYPEWRTARRDAIVRDNGCDLAHPDYQITSEPIYVHHINPITIDDILGRNPMVFDLNNLICTIHSTHNAIHYGNASMLPIMPEERRPNDMCPWR